MKEKSGEEHEAKLEAYRRELVKSFQQYAAGTGRISVDNILSLSNISDPDKVADIIASNLNISFYEQQELLELIPLIARMEKLMVMLRREMQIASYETELAEKVKIEVDKNQKEYFLREQMKVISRELGEEQDIHEEVNSCLQKLSELAIPKEFHEKLTKEIKRLPNFPSNFS